MSIDPTVLLRGDHRKVEHLLHQIEQADPADRPPLVQELTTDLTAHMKLEEQVLYPVIADALGAREAAEAEQEHELAKVGLAKVAELAPDGPGFMAALEMLKAGITHHVQDEEEKVFPELDQKLPDDRRERLAQDMEQARTALGLPTRDELPVYLSKDELYEKAKRSGVAGRSSMSKDELAAVVPPGKS